MKRIPQDRLQRAMEALSKKLNPDPRKREVMWVILAVPAEDGIATPESMIHILANHNNDVVGMLRRAAELQERNQSQSEAQ